MPLFFYFFFQNYQRQKFVWGHLTVNFHSHILILSILLLVFLYGITVGHTHRRRIDYQNDPTKNQVWSNWLKKKKNWYLNLFTKHIRVKETHKTEIFEKSKQKFIFSHFLTYLLHLPKLLFILFNFLSPPNPLPFQPLPFPFPLLSHHPLPFPRFLLFFFQFVKF